MYNFKLEYQKSRITYCVNALARRVVKHNIYEQNYCKSVLSGEEGNTKIAKLIESEKPFMVARFGGNEIRALADVIYEREGGKLGGLSKRSRFKLVNQAGFFPNEKECFYRFADEYIEAAKQVDMLGVWNMFMQGEITRRYIQNSEYCELRSIEPYYFENPWSKSLEGKKVLVIHPFADTIASQYKKREKLFDNKEVLPEFELQTIKAVQTIAGAKDDRFKDWFEALEFMYNEAMKKDFDISLIGCGAYGFPLAAKIKKAGKQAVHMGGSLQILFGIKGKRWDKHELIGKFYSDAWVRPGEKEKVNGSSVVENSCYW